MSDFSELENELKKLRPARPSPVLFARVEEAMVNSESAKIIRPDRFRVNYAALGLGLAAAAVLLLLAKVNTDLRQGPSKSIVQNSPAPKTAGRPWYRRIEIVRRIYSCRCDAGRLQHARRGIAIHEPLGATAAAPSLSDEGDVAVA